MSDVDFTEEGNLLMAWGNDVYRVREIDGNSISTDGSGAVLLDMQINHGIYRADKMPLYPYQDENKKYSMDYNEKIGK